MFRSFIVMAVVSITLTGSTQPIHAQDAQTSLWNATVAGDTIAMSAALGAGAKVDSLDVRRSPNGRKALNWAALNNRVDAIRFLLAHGALIEGTNLTGFTALQHAAEAGSLDATRALLAAGADPNQRSADGLKASERARQRGHTAVADLIEAAEKGERPKPE